MFSFSLKHWYMLQGWEGGQFELLAECVYPKSTKLKSAFALKPHATTDFHVTHHPHRPRRHLLGEHLGDLSSNFEDECRGRKRTISGPLDPRLENNHGERQRANVVYSAWYSILKTFKTHVKCCRSNHGEFTKF
jgi:hypothetical protein